MTIERVSGTKEIIPLNSFFQVHVGDVIELCEMGGPGYGNPPERDAEFVVRDVRDGYLSIAKAAEVYGVIVDEGGLVDEKATIALRRKLQRQ